MVMEPSELITRNWEGIKQLILAKWDRVHEVDLREIHPTVRNLMLLIKKKYSNLPQESIIQDLENLIFQYKHY